MARARRHQAEVALARERARRDLLAEVAGDLGVSEEKALINNVETAKAQKVTLGEHAALIKRKLEAYEAAWRRVKDATGVGEIGEVTSKMAGQVEQHSQLTTLSRDNSARLEATREEIEAFRRWVFLRACRVLFVGGSCGCLLPSIVCHVCSSASPGANQRRLHLSLSLVARLLLLHLPLHCAGLWRSCGTLAVPAWQRAASTVTTAAAISTPAVVMMVAITRAMVTGVVVHGPAWHCHHQGQLQHCLLRPQTA